MDHQIRLDIQGLRAVAVFLVVLFHADVGGFAGGFIGVDVFFVISGYVVTGSLLRNHLPFDGAAFGAFVRRRVRRILPALAAMLAVTATLSVLLLPASAQRTAWRTGGSASLIVANWYLAIEPASTGYFLSTADRNPFLHTWSLSVEEQFYIGLPIVLLLVGKRAAPKQARQRFFWTFVGLGVLSFGLAVLVVDIVGRFTEWTFYASPFRAWEFLAGCSLVALRPGHRRFAYGWIPGLGLIVASAVTLSADSAVPGVITLAPVLGTMLILQSVPQARLLSWGPLVWIGDRSYGWYLWHWPAIVFAQLWWPTNSWAAVGAAFCALVPAALSYRWLENPIRRRERMTNDLRLVAACIAVPMAAVVLLGGAEAVVSGDSRVESYEAAAELPGSYRLGCHTASLADLPDACNFGAVSGAGPRILLSGDSNAAQIDDAVIEAGTSLGATVTVVTKSSCPAVAMAIHNRPSAAGSCYEWASINRDLLAQTAFDVIVVASASDLVILQNTAEDERPVSLTPDSPQVIDPAGVAEIYRLALTEFAESAGPTGAHIVIVHPIPRPLQSGRWKMEDCPVGKVLFSESACAVPFTDNWEALRELAVTVEDEVADRFAWVSTVDLAPALCPGICSMRNGQGDWLWRDSNHLGDGASETVQPVFVDVFESLLSRQ